MRRARLRIARSGAVATALAALLGCAAMAAHGDDNEPYSEAAVKAAFLYRFTSYVEWPEPALAGNEFTIALLGAPEVAADLGGLLREHTIKDRGARAVQIKSIKDLGQAQVLYVGRGYGRDLQPLIAALADRPLLIVTDHEHALEAGSTVNFLVVDRRVRFEVSLAAAERAGLRISSELLSVAARVLGGRLRSDASCIWAQTGDRNARCPVRVVTTPRASHPREENDGAAT